MLETRLSLWRRLWAYIKMVTFPLLLPEPREEFFLAFHHENLVRFLEVNPQRCESSPVKIATQRVSHFCGNPYSAYINSSKLQIKSSYQFVTLVVSSAPVKQSSAVILCIHLSLQISGGSLSCDLTYLWWVQKKLVFTLFSFFSIRMAVVNPSSLYVIVEISVP